MLVGFPYARRWRQNSAVGEDLEKLKQRLPLLDYLRQQNWTARPAGHASEFVGLCPLHAETRPSFYVNARKNLFFCHGCDLTESTLLDYLRFQSSLQPRPSPSTINDRVADADRAIR